ELEVEKDARATLANHAHGLRAGMEEELLADLERAHLAAQPVDELLGLGEGRNVEPGDEAATHAGRTGCRPTRGHRHPIISLSARAASPTGRSATAPSRRWRSSSTPRPSPFGPTVTRSGIPIRSASLNFTPGRSSRSSSSGSTPAARSS